jgi:branched-chain amino acid transport system permease protein
MQIRFGFNPWLGLPVSALAGAAAGWLMCGVVVSRRPQGVLLRAHHLGFCRGLAHRQSNSVDITGGGLGMLIPMKQTAANFQFEDRQGVLFHHPDADGDLGCAGPVAARRSRFGARLAAIRENEDSARALGIDVLHREESRS